MSLKESLQKKLETQTEYWSKQIQTLQADAEEKMAKAEDDQAEAEIQKDFSERIEALQNRVEEARNKISVIRASAKDLINNVKARIAK